VGCSKELTVPKQRKRGENGNGGKTYSEIKGKKGWLYIHVFWGIRMKGVYWGGRFREEMESVL